MTRPIAARTILFCLVGLNVANNWSSAQSVKPLQQAHAHNDYEHDRPLHDALDHGFCSVEADIFLVNGELLVGHNRWSLRKDRTLKRLYLDPLAKIVESNNGRVHKDSAMFMLLIDFKHDGNKIYPILKKQLQEYSNMLSGIHDGKYQQRAIQVVISGSCPRKMITDDETRLVSIDGRFSDLDSNAPADFIPLISMRWSSQFKWRGRTQVTEQEINKLTNITRKAHERGRRVRFWATPESTAVWDRLFSAQVDHINTDKLARLQKYLLEKHKTDSN